jgi:hypothetical protein
MSDQDTSPAPKRLDTALAVEIGICVFLIVVFSWMFSHSYEWDIEAGLFPRLISGFGVASVLAYLAQITWQNLKGHAGRAGRILDIPWAKVSGDSGSVKRTAVGVIAWVLGFWLGIWFLGFHIAAPVYLYSQMVIYGNVSKWIAALAETTWNDPLFFDLVKELLSI